MRKTNRKDNRKAKSLMKLYGISGKDVAAHAGVSHHTVYVVLGGFRKSARIQKATVQLIQRHDRSIQYADIWPPDSTENSKAA